jgi:ATP-dependent DNA helicase DinG
VSIIDYFQKDKTPREGQITILLAVAKAILEGYKNIIIEAPTGVGKSAIAYTLLKFLKTGYIVTSTKSLQSQYGIEYPEFFQMKGKVTFPCAYKAESKIKGDFECGICNLPFDECSHRSCNSGPCITEGVFKNELGKNACPYHVDIEDYSVNEIEDTVNYRGLIQNIVLLPHKLEQMRLDRVHNRNLGLDLQKKLSKKKKQQIVDNLQPCEYFEQLATSLLADHSILNYSNYILFSHMQKLPHRNVTVFDEAHDIENQIIKFTELSFNVNNIKEILYEVGEDPESVQIPDQYDIMLHIPFMEKMQGFLDTVAGMQATNDKKRQLKKRAGELRDLIKRTRDFIMLDVNNWKVIELKRNDYTNLIEKAVYKPINLSKFCNMIYRNSSYNIFMSATILDKEMFCENHGLDPALTEYVTVPSDFPVENRPIYRLNVAKLNRITIQLPSVRKKIIDAIDKLMTKYYDKKGIIHCTSYEQVDWIIEGLSQKNKSRLIRTRKGEDSSIVVEAHKKDPRPTVLISPSLNTGIDLKYDDSRFQIIVKVPYPDQSDMWIEAKRQDNPRWYIYKTVLWLVQAYGRSIRAKDDQADTYILDAKFDDIMRNIQYVRIMPKWFRAAVVRTTTVQ